MKGPWLYLYDYRSYGCSALGTRWSVPGDYDVAALS